jgi:[phosphatase 2A protein]-leucine-carboxy methyltransferase
MAAPHIPNLLTFRGGARGGRGGRRGGQGRGHALLPPPTLKTDTFSEDDLQSEIDKRVQFTDLDASHSRASAVKLGYLTDAYINEFHTGPTPRRQPIINRGELMSDLSLLINS